MAVALVGKKAYLSDIFLAKNWGTVIFNHVRLLSNEASAAVDKGKRKIKPSLYDIYRAQKPSGLTEQGDSSIVIKDLESRLEEEKKKILNKNLQIELKKSEWKASSVRAGAVGVKIGMSTIWRKDGKKVKVSLLQLIDCEVMDSRLGRKDGGDNHHTEVIIGGVDEKDLHKLSERIYGEFVKYGINPKKKLYGFEVTKDAILPSGTKIHAAHFCPGQHLRISGISQDLGFQGVMKRWGMKGQPASHGQTKTHRKMGATGGGGTPGRIFPGKKMPGHMGGNRVVLPCVMLYRVNTKYNVLYVSGQVPGAVGDFVKIQDSRVRKSKFPHPPSFPTFIPEEEDALAEDIYSDDVHPYTEGSFTFEGD